MRAQLAWIVVAGVVLGAGLAEARRKPALDRMELDPGDYPVEPCGKGKTWPIVKKCLEKTGSTVAIVHQTDKTRAITVTPKGSTAARVLLYAQNEQGWIRTSPSLYPNANADLIKVEPFDTPQGQAMRFDVGNTARTTFTVNPPTIVRGVLRRTFTTVCAPSGWSCFTMMTSCEAYVRGKVYFSFHGELVSHPSLGIRMKGSRKAAGGICKPNESLMVDPENGDD